MAVTVAQLIDRGKLVSDRRNDASLADTDWLIFVNWAVEAWWRFLTPMDTSLYFAQGDFALLATAAGAIKDLTTLAAPVFRSLHGLDLSPDTTSRRTIGRRNFRERNLAAVGPWLPTTWATDRRYDIRGKNLVITPFESAAGTYRIYYRGAPYHFTSAVDATALDLELEQYEEGISILAGRYAMGIEETDPSFWTGRLGEMRDEVQAAYDRNDGEPAVIADVEEDGWGFR
jgi:hypothetical protein